MFLKKFRRFAKSKLIVLFVCLFINQTILSEGFLAGTLVKTQDGYKPIDQLKKNDLVTSYSFKDKFLVDGKITKIQTKHYKTCIKFTIAGKDIITAPDHKFYCPLHEKYRWIKAKDLKPNDFISSNLTECVRIDNVYELNQEADFYCLTIDKYQNFFVSEQNIFVHNFVLETTIFGIPAILEISPFLLAGLVAGVGRLISGSSAKPCYDSYISDKQLFGSAAATSTGLILYKKMTNKEAREKAEEMGFREIKVDADTHGSLVFEDKKGRKISPDQDGHGESIWKEIDRKNRRIASLDENLKPIRK